MKLTELIEEVGATLAPRLLINDAAVLLAIGKTALREFDERVGVVMEQEFTREELDAGFDLEFEPSQFMYVLDRGGEFYLTSISGGALVLDEPDGAMEPFKAHYIGTLATLDHDSVDLPQACMAVVSRYLKVLLEEVNTPRTIAAYESSGIGLEGVKTLADIRAEKERIEVAMDESEQLLPMAGVYF